MHEFISGPKYKDFFCTMETYDMEVLDGAAAVGIDCFSSMTEDQARVYYLLTLRAIAGEFNDCQQACMPWAAQAFGVKLPCFHPGNSVGGIKGGTVCGGRWSKQTMGPLTPSGSEATMYLSVAVFLHEHAFDSIQKFRETITVRKDGVFRMSLPKFNHWVLLLPPANADSLQVVDERAAAVSAGKARNVMEKETAARAAGDSATQEADKKARQEQKKAADAAAAVSVRKASCSCAG
ncbi:unnamed protein product [Pylaiella littoralis]